MSALYRIVKSEIYKYGRSLGLIIICSALLVLSIGIASANRFSERARPMSESEITSELSYLLPEENSAHLQAYISSLDEEGIENSITSFVHNFNTYYNKIETTASELMQVKTVPKFIDYLYACLDFEFLILNDYDSWSNESWINNVLYTERFLDYFDTPLVEIYYTVFESISYARAHYDMEALDDFELRNISPSSFNEPDKFWSWELYDDVTYGQLVTNSHSSNKIWYNSMLENVLEELYLLSLKPYEIDEINSNIREYTKTINTQLEKTKSASGKQKRTEYELLHSYTYALSNYVNNQYSVYAYSDFSDAEINRNRPILSIQFNRYSLNSELNISKYVLKNGVNLYQNSTYTYSLNISSILQIPYGTTSLSVAASYSSFYSTASLLCTIVLSAFMGIMAIRTIAGEASSGTMKLVLLRPYKRFKLMLGKFIALALILFAAILVATTAYTIVGALFFAGTGCGFILVFNATNVFLIHPIAFSLLNLVSDALFGLFILGFGFMCATLTKKQGGAYSIFFVGLYVVLIAAVLLQFVFPTAMVGLFTSHIPLMSFFSPVAAYQDMKLWVSLLVVGLYTSLFATLPLLQFTARDY